MPTTSAPSAINWDKFPQFSTSKRDRINHIDAALRSARKRGNVTLPNAKKFALELKVVPNTIYSTIRDMQDTLTLPVEFDAVRNGYFYAEDVVATPFSRISEKEMLAVYLSEQMMSTFHKLPLRKHVRSAFRKLIDQSGDGLSFDAAMVEDAFSITPSHPAYFHPRHFEMCCNAVLRQEELLIDYNKQHGKGAGVPELRRVKPLHLTFRDFAWHLLNWDHKAKDYRLFMLTRMNSIKETRVKFGRPAAFNAQQLLRKNFSVFTSGEKVDVSLEFSARVKRLVKEREWHHTEKFTNLAEGRLGMTMNVAITPDLVAWIASYLDDCQIIGPTDLREDIARRQLRAAIGNGIDVSESLLAKGERSLSPLW